MYVGTFIAVTEPQFQVTTRSSQPRASRVSTIRVYSTLEECRPRLPRRTTGEVTRVLRIPSIPRSYVTNKSYITVEPDLI